MITRFFLPRLALALSAILSHACVAAAQEQGGQSLDQAASDPTASLMSFQLQGFHSYRLHNLDDGSCQGNLT